MAGFDDLSVALSRLGMTDRGASAALQPVLLRVVVDLFLQKTHHAPEDLNIFEAIVTPLLERVDRPARRQILDKLARHAATPPALLERLMDDAGRIEADLYQHASLEEAELIAVAERGPVVNAAAIALRAGLPSAVIRALLARPERRIVLNVAANAALALDASDVTALIERALKGDIALAERLVERGLNGHVLAPLFPLVSRQHRRLIIDAVRRAELGRRQWGRPDRATAATLSQLDQLVLRGEWDGFDLVLCLALGCDESALKPLLHDGTGDVLALALAAVGASPELAARVFILGDPSVGRSVPAVRRLVTLVDTVSTSAARRLIEAMLGGDPMTGPRTAAPGRISAQPGGRHLSVAGEAKPEAVATRSRAARG